MKRILIYVVGLFMSVSAIAQDLGLSNVNMAPNPARQNQTITYSFTFQNPTATAVPVNPGNPILIRIFTRKLNPGTLSVTGTASNLFTWQYIPGTGSSGEIRGTHSQTIPAGSGGEPFGGTISFDAIVAEQTPDPGTAATQGHGANVNLIPNNLNANNTNNDNISAFGYTDGVLPVAFGNIEAVFVGSKLKVDWQTLSEKNNKEFTIDASHNGTEFHQIGTVATQARDGNSDSELNYSFSRDWKELVALSGFSFLAAFILMLMMAMVVPVARKRLYLTIPVLAVLIGVVLFSCRKKDNVDIGDRPTLFIRIGQTDIDGGVNYSKIVKVIEK